LVPDTAVAPVLQAYVTPVAGVAVRVTDVTVQVKSPDFVRLALGACVFAVTCTLAVAKQPFEAVTVTV
jgi:hypothetical protein